MEYPVPKRRGEVEVRRFAEEERLFDRGLNRPAVNGLLTLLQDRLGSKNKLGLAIYGRKNAAGAVKQVMDGVSRYTDDMLDRILKLADEHGIPRPSVSEPAQAAEVQDNPADGPPAATVPTTDVETEHASVDDAAARMDMTDGDAAAAPDVDATANSEDPMAETALPEAPVDTDVLPAEAPAMEHRADDVPRQADWLDGVRRRRAAAADDIKAADRRLQDLHDQMERLHNEAHAVAAEQEVSRNIVREIDSALSILEAL